MKLKNCTGCDERMGLQDSIVGSTNIEFFFFVIFPYLAILTCIIGSFLRYRYHQYTYSALSSQFFGSDKFAGWGLRLGHYGIFIILFGHFLAMVFTEPYLALKDAIGHIHPIFKLLLDGIRIIAGLAALIGFLLLIIRHVVNPYVRKITTPMDITILILLFIQIASGIILIVLYLPSNDPNWFSKEVAPWFQGIFLLQPKIPKNISFFAKFHILLPFFILMFLPFGRLVHIFTFPALYLIRPYQVVIWYRKRGKDCPQVNK